MESAKRISILIMENNLVKIKKKLKLDMSNLKVIYMVTEVIEKNGKMTIDEFRAIVCVCPGISTALTEALDMPIHEAIAFVKRGKFTADMLDDLFCELEVKLGIYEAPICRRQVD